MSCVVLLLFGGGGVVLARPACYAGFTDKNGQATPSLCGVVVLFVRQTLASHCLA